MSLATYEIVGFDCGKFFDLEVDNGKFYFAEFNDHLTFALSQALVQGENLQFRNVQTGEISIVYCVSVERVYRGQGSDRELAEMVYRLLTQKGRYVDLKFFML